MIGLGLTAFIIIARWWTNLDRKIEKAKDEEDKKIDGSNDATDLLRRFDELRDKG